MLYQLLTVKFFLDVNLFKKGIRPSVNVGISVSRIGSAAQNSFMKELSGSLKLDLALFREVEIFTTFKSELDEVTASILDKGVKLTEILIQPNYKPLVLEIELALLSFTKCPIFTLANMEEIIQFKEYIINSVEEYSNMFDFTDESSIGELPDLLEGYFFEIRPVVDLYSEEEEENLEVENLEEGEVNPENQQKTTI